MKKIIRQKLLHKRESLAPDVVLTKSQKIFDTLKTFPLYQNAKSIMMYIDFHNEVKTNHMISDLLLQKKNVLIPISIPATKEIILSQLLNPEKELIKSTYGILEPKKEYIRKRDPAILDLMVLPGIAFDLKGYRIGYGGGYYDRFLDQLQKTIPTIALAFDFQIIDTVPIESFDRPVDYIITETKILSCNMNDFIL